MLTALELKDFAIVDELRLELAPGLNALTGETGAGKSLLVDALALLVGQRADTGMIRSGCSVALVQGEFDTGTVHAELGDTGMADTGMVDTGMVETVAVSSASRRLQAEGRSSARLDGELVTVAELAERVGALVAVHGQHAAQALSLPDEPRKRLDRLLGGGDRDALEEYRKAYGEYQKTQAALADLLETGRERERRRDTLRFEIDEIDAAALEPGEQERLRERSERLRHGERIVQNAAQALTALTDGDLSTVALLGSATRSLDTAARFHSDLEPLAAELRDALSAIQATSSEVESFLADFELDPAELERVEQRLVRIESLQRKYGDGVDSILSYRRSAAEELARLDSADFDADELQRRKTELEGKIAQLGGRIGAARAAAAERLGREVGELLDGLGMPGARFEVRLESLEEPGRHGLERIRFAFGANPGEPLGDLAEVGSGGELSRVMLALDVVTGSDRPVLVFDEVDAGIGGQAARSVGSLLKKLSREHQVLVVTHLPQVAAFADAQYFVEKRSKQGRTVTRVHRLEPHEREQELARMLSGSVTDASLRNARELVADSDAI